MYGFSPEWISALGATFLHSLWQATLLALLLWIGSRYLPFGPRSRYRLAFGALMTQLIISGVTLFLVFPTPAPSGVMMEGAAGWDASSLLLTAASPEASPLAVGWSMPYEGYFLLFLLWGIGVTLGTLRLAGGYAYYHYFFRREVLDVPREWIAVAEGLLERLSYRGINPHLSTSSRLRSPALMGLMKPLIVFPLAMINQLSPEQVEAVLAHELSHLSRYDHWANFLQSLVEILFYCNPAVHWIGRRIREEREHCCDDQVARLGIDPLVYAKTLYQLEEQRQLSPRIALAARSGSLLARIERLLRNTPNHYRMKPGLLIFLLLLVGSLFSFHPATDKEDAPHASVDTTVPAFPDEPSIFQPSSLASPSDTLPPRSGSRTQIHVNRDGRELELEKVDGEITKFKVDGEVIPEDRFDEYRDLIREMEAGVHPGPGNGERFYFNREGGQNFRFRSLDGEDGDVRFYFPGGDSVMIVRPGQFEGDYFFSFPGMDSLPGLHGQGNLFDLDSLYGLHAFPDLKTLYERNGLDGDVFEKLQGRLEDMQQRFEFRSLEKMEGDSAGLRWFHSGPEGSSSHYYLRSLGDDDDGILYFEDDRITPETRERLRAEVERLREEQRRLRSEMRELERGQFRELRQDQRELRNEQLDLQRDQTRELRESRRAREEVYREQNESIRKERSTREREMRDRQKERTDVMRAREREAQARNNDRMEELRDRERSALFRSEVHRISSSRFLEMVRDFQSRGLIEGSEVSRFQISEKRLKVNGKRIDADTFKRFQREYEDRYNVSWFEDLGSFNLEFTQ